MVEIIPKKIKKAPEWYNLGFYIAAALLIVVVLGYAILFYFENRALNNLQDLEERISQVGTQEEKNMEVEVLLAKKRISDFAELLQSHKKSSNFFTLLEETSHPKVWLTEVDLYPEKAEVLVSGKTLNFQTLGQQLFIFQDQESINQVELANLLIGEGGETEFSFYFYLDPQVFK